jgi:hypothetical protein
MTHGNLAAFCNTYTPKNNVNNKEIVLNNSIPFASFSVQQELYHLYTLSASLSNSALRILYANSKIENNQYPIKDVVVAKTGALKSFFYLFKSILLLYSHIFNTNTFSDIDITMRILQNLNIPYNGNFTYSISFFMKNINIILDSFDSLKNTIGTATYIYNVLSQKISDPRNEVYLNIGSIDAENADVAVQLIPNEINLSLGTVAVPLIYHFIIAFECNQLVYVSTRLIEELKTVLKSQTLNTFNVPIKMHIDYAPIDEVAGPSMGAIPGLDVIPSMVARPSLIECKIYMSYLDLITSNMDALSKSILFMDQLETRELNDGIKNTIQLLNPLLSAALSGLIGN